MAAIVLHEDIGGTGAIVKAACVEDAEEGPADLGFFLSGELDADGLGGEFFEQHAVETFARARFVFDDVEGIPDGFEGADGSEDIHVILAMPFEAFDDAIGGGLEEGKSGIHPIEQSLGV